MTLNDVLFRLIQTPTFTKEVKGKRGPSLLYVPAVVIFIWFHFNFIPGHTAKNVVYTHSFFYILFLSVEQQEQRVEQREQPNTTCNNKTQIKDI